MLTAQWSAASEHPAPTSRRSRSRETKEKRRARTDNKIGQKSEPPKKFSYFKKNPKLCCSIKESLKSGTNKASYILPFYRLTVELSNSLQKWWFLRDEIMFFSFAFSPAQVCQTHFNLKGTCNLIRFDIARKVLYNNLNVLLSVQRSTDALWKHQTL